MHRQTLSRRTSDQTTPQVGTARRLTLTIWIALGMALVALPAQAYLDPASGSMILQLILGGVAGAAVVIKLYWHKLLGLFGAKKEENDDPAA